MDDNTNTELSSMSEQLYDFLKEYNLIQSEIPEEEIKKLLEKSLAHTDEDEEVITSFVSNYKNKDNASSSAFLITKSNRIVMTPLGEEPRTLDLLTVESLQNIPEDENHLLINTENNADDLTLIAVDEEGKNTLVDALYTAFSMVLPEDKLKDLFGEVSEAEQEPEQEVIENNTQGQDQDIIDVIPVDEKGTEETKKQTSEKEEPVKKDNKPLMFIIGAIVLVAIVVVAYFLFTNVSQNTASNAEVENLVNLFNQTDGAYFTARNYQQQGIPNTTPEQWQELSNNINAVEEEYLGIERSDNETVDSLYQVLNSYIQAVITGTYYGQQAATNDTPLYQNSLVTNLDRANNERLQFLTDLQENYPDMMEKIENQTDLSQEHIKYPQSEEAQRLIDEANSRGSSEGISNTRSSSEAVENSRHSREN